MQPRKLCEAQSADSFCAALRKPSWRHVWSWNLHQTHGESLLQERGEVCGVEGQGLGALWMEEGLLQRLGEAGKKGSTWHGHQGAPPAENLQGGLVSKNLPHERTGVGRRRGQLVTKELEGPR